MILNETTKEMEKYTGLAENHKRVGVIYSPYFLVQFVVVVVNLILSFFFVFGMKLPEIAFISPSFHLRQKHQRNPFSHFYSDRDKTPMLQSCQTTEESN